MADRICRVAAAMPFGIQRCHAESSSAMSTPGSDAMRSEVMRFARFMQISYRSKRDTTQGGPYFRPPAPL